MRKACTSVKEQLSGADGATSLLTKLKELHGVTLEQAKMTAYEKFDNCKRTKGMDINKYISQFEQLKLKLENNRMKLPT